MTLLLTLLLKSLLIFALTGVALLLLRRASAAARHFVCLLTLFALLALPLFSLTLPGLRLPVPVQVHSELTLPEPTPAQAPPLPKREGQEVGAGLAPALRNSPALPNSLSSPLGRTPAKSLVTKQGGGFLLLLYLTGVLTASLRPLLGLWGIARLRRLCTDVRDTPTLAVAARCAALLGLQTPRLCRADVCVPMTWGWRRPVILLPSGSVGWPEDRLQSVLLHEMAHIKRRDWPGHRLADLVCALYWFHPFVWLTARRLRAESELACDDLVLSSGIPAPDYARHLLEIAQALRPASAAPQAAIGMAQTSRIEGRIMMLLDKTRPRRALTRRVLLLALLPTTTALITLAVLRPIAKAQAVSQVEEVQAAGNIPIQLVGVTTANHSGGRWWKPNGQVLPSDVYDTAALPDGTSLSDSHAKNVTFAFRFPSGLEHVTVLFAPVGTSGYASAGSWPGKMQGQENQTEAQIDKNSGGTRVLSAAFPLLMKKATIRVGVASGGWTKAASDSNLTGGFSTGTSDAMFLFSPAAITQDGSVVTVSTGEMKQDIQFVSVDAQGKEHLPFSISATSSDRVSQYTLRFDLPLSQMKNLRVEVRPFAWTEFKNVALQPGK